MYIFLTCRGDGSGNILSATIILYFPGIDYVKQTKPNQIEPCVPINWGHNDKQARKNIYAEELMRMCSDCQKAEVS